MLPRCDTFKEVIFMPRLVAYNESFVPAGKKSKIPPTAVIWHDAIQGRSKENIISSFYQYFLSIRDIECVTLWVDNCSAQNKNWCLYSFFVYLVNSSEVSLKQINVKYFESGHTFMAADSFHHQVENSLKHKGKVYDFSDYVEAVRNSTKCTKTIEMSLEMFYEWKDHASQCKLKKTEPRPYLHDMSEVIFTRGKKTLIYKKSFSDEGCELNFLNFKAQKQG